MLTLSLPAARALHLSAQGLLTAPRRKAKPADLMAAIRNMGALQIDTIHVVARSPYLVLWSRLGDYEPVWLEQALADGKLFEYWAHEACFLPVEDYGLFRHRMIDPLSMGWKYSHEWMQRHRDSITALVEHIRSNGPVKSSDFERKDGQKGGGWWSWKPEKRSLEVLFTAGELMVAKRQNFQRVYDLRERVLPHWSDDRDLRPALDCRRDLLLQGVKALGFAQAGWAADYYRLGRLEPELHPAKLAEQGLLVEARVDGWKAPVYLHPDRLELARQAEAGTLKPSYTTLLSPFDPVVWDRKRAVALWDFDYRLECYTPGPKRRYGYFVLPILRRGQLVGRLDAKAHRQQGVFEVKALYLEPGVRLSDRLAADVAGAIQRSANWHGTPTVRVEACDPARFGEMLRDALATE